MKKILVVEDTIVLAEQIKDILKMEGFDTHVVHDGIEAGNWLSRNKPDLIITDLLMPGIDGFQMIEVIRQVQYLKDIPIIILSAKTDNDTLAAASGLGVVAFIGKPCKPLFLLNTVRKALYGHG